MWPRIPGGAGGEGGVSAPGALARPRGDRKPGHRGLSLAAAAQPQPGRKFCRALSAGASLAILLNRKQGSAGAGRWRRERRTPSPRAPVGTSGGEISEQTPRGAGAGPDREEGAELGVRVPQVAGPHQGAPRACSPSHRAGAGAARARSPRPGRRVEAKGCPPSGGGKGPGPGPHADPSVGAAVARVARAVDPGYLLATVPALQGSSPLLPSLLFSSLRQGRGRSRGAGPRPTEPETLRSGGRPYRGNPAPSFSRPSVLRPERALGGRRWARSG